MLLDGVPGGALGTTNNRAGEVQSGGQSRATRDDERVKFVELAVVFVDRFFERIDPSRINTKWFIFVVLVERVRQVGAEIE